MYLFKSQFFHLSSVNHVTETIIVRSEIIGKCSWRVNTGFCQSLTPRASLFRLVLKEQVH